jgi:hypothetical protein
MFGSVLDPILNGGCLPWSMTAGPQVRNRSLVLPNITRCGVSGAALGRLRVSILLSTAKLWLVSCRLDRRAPLDMLTTPDLQSQRSQDYHDASGHQSDPLHWVAGSARAHQRPHG